MASPGYKKPTSHSRSRKPPNLNYSPINTLPFCITFQPNTKSSSGIETYPTTSKHSIQLAADKWINIRCKSPRDVIATSGVSPQSKEHKTNVASTIWTCLICGIDVICNKCPPQDSCWIDSPGILMACNDRRVYLHSRRFLKTSFRRLIYGLGRRKWSSEED